MPQLEQLSAYRLADNLTRAQMSDCYTAMQRVNNVDRAALNCSATEYSLMIDFYGGAIGNTYENSCFFINRSPTEDIIIIRYQ